MSAQHRFQAFLRFSALVGAFTSFGAPARAQEAPPAPACEALEKDLERAKADLRKAEQALTEARSHEAAEVELRSTLSETQQRLRASEALASSCDAARTNLCASAGTFARGVAQGRVQLGGVQECIADSDRRALVEQLSGWSNVSAALGQWGAYAVGESDVEPRLGPTSGAKVERLLARLFSSGRGTPIVQRRLLIEALRTVAPRFVKGLKSSPGGIERWFSEVGQLDEVMVAEVHAGASGSSSEPTSALSTASELVNAYRVVAGCSGAKPPRDCKRADQLRQLLESSGPLVVRRRIQDVWASECSSLTEGVIKTWLLTLPTGRASEAELESLSVAVNSKLVTCFLRDETVGTSFSAWLTAKMPPSSDEAALGRMRQQSRATSAELDACARAVRAMQTLPPPRECDVNAAFVADIDAWVSSMSEDVSSFGRAVCDRLGRSLWSGQSTTLANAFDAPPTVEDAVVRPADGSPTSVGRLRQLCADRVGTDARFTTTVRELGRRGQKLGDSAALSPWNLDPKTFEPVEVSRVERVRGVKPWLASLVNRDAACSALELTPERCRICREAPEGTHFDCSLVAAREEAWSQKTRLLLGGILLVVVLVLLGLWSLRLRRAHRQHGQWLRDAVGHLEGIGFESHPDRFRYVFPSRFARLWLKLPEGPVWERLGRSALVLRSSSRAVSDRDVHLAAATARSMGVELALLVHDETAPPNLGAVRAILDWSARGSGKAVQVVPLSWNRLQWGHSAADVLELFEDSSLRQNPFDLRGRVTSSTQFFDRERLVSGLLAGAQAGRFTVVTGLRRFGKSSLALEVVRRLPGPAAYVDLAGFHHEIRFSKNPTDAADSILRFTCFKLLESAKARYSEHSLPLEVPTGAMDAATLTTWFATFGRHVTELEAGKPPPALLVFDELEQAIGAAEQLDHALEVFAILVGRLRNALPGMTSREGGQRVGMLLCSALHPLLWSPLGTLAHQSLMGSFEYVTVPCLPREAASAMMRGLGGPQGITFTEAALQLLVDESQSVPLLLRRLGSAVLELYDPERARQGALGAVEIGVEGVRAAVDRETTEGSPLRVWVESEIAEPSSPGGAVLRALASSERAPATELRRVASQAFRRQFEVTGVALALSAHEADRRAEEAAGVTIRMLGESGLLVAHGDPTEPDWFELPKGVIRTILRAAAK